MVSQLPALRHGRRGPGATEPERSRPTHAKGRVGLPRAPAPASHFKRKPQRARRSLADPVGFSLGAGLGQIRERKRKTRGETWLENKSPGRFLSLACPCAPAWGTGREGGMALGARRCRDACPGSGCPSRAKCSGSTGAPRGTAEVNNLRLQQPEGEKLCGFPSGLEKQPHHPVASAQEVRQGRGAFPRSSVNPHQPARLLPWGHEPPTTQLSQVSPVHKESYAGSSRLRDLFYI